MKEAASFIRERDDFLVVSHVQPDGDAISSTIAVGWLLEKLGKRYTMLNEGPIPARLSYLWNSKAIHTLVPGLETTEDAVSSRFNSASQQSEAVAHQYANVICVDCADFGRVGPASAWFAPDAALLNIDHHATNDSYGNVNLLRFDAAATAEIVYELIAELGVSLDEAAATALYTGLLTDTGGFRYSNTSPHVMQIAASLLEAGAPGHQLAELLLERMTMGQMGMIQRGLSRLVFSEDQQIGWLWVTSEDLEETGASNEDLEGLVNYPRNIEGVKVGLLFKENGTKSVKVSMRSSGEVSVAAIAQQFGGGGHVRAAGCRLTVPLGEAIEQVVGAVRKALHASE